MRTYNGSFIPLPGPTMPDSTRKQAAPCGAWASPITAAVVAAGATPLSGVLLDGDDVFWLAGRASEGGRNTLLRQRAGEAVGTDAGAVQRPHPRARVRRRRGAGGGRPRLVLEFRRQPHLPHRPRGDRQRACGGQRRRRAALGRLRAGPRHACAWWACAKTIRPARPIPSTRCAPSAPTAARRAGRRQRFLFLAAHVARTAGSLAWL